MKLKPTASDIEGPFYKAGAPFRERLAGYPELWVEGRVLNTDGKPLEGAVVDYWHADHDGKYDLDGYNFRGRTTTNKNGEYRFATIMPGDYEIGENEFRCAHVHVKVSSPGFKLLTTQLYFPDNPHNGTDQWFDPDRVIGYPRGTFDFVLETAPFPWGTFAGVLAVLGVIFVPPFLMWMSR